MEAEGEYMGNVGGAPEAMSGGAAKLHSCGSHIEAMRAAVNGAGARAAEGAGDGNLAGALDRWASAWSTMLGDTGLQIVTAAQLAANAAADLQTAGGGH
jgi:hypothetical protein